MPYFKIAGPLHNWGGGGGGYIHIISCSHSIKTIAFQRNLSGTTQIYEYAPPPPIIGLAMPLKNRYTRRTCLLMVIALLPRSLINTQ